MTSEFFVYRPMKPDADIEMYKLDTGEEMMVEKESYLLYDDSRFLGMLYEWKVYGFVWILQENI